MEPAGGRVSSCQRRRALARLPALPPERSWAGKPAGPEVAARHLGLQEDGKCRAHLHESEEATDERGSSVNRLPQNGGQPPVRYSPLRLPGFDVTWAGPHPFLEGGFAFGSEDGRLLLTDAAGLARYSPV